MKRVTVLAVVLILSALPVQAQKKKYPKTRPRTVHTPAANNTNASRIVGSHVVIVTKNGDHVAGEVLDLSVYSIRIRSDKLESTIAMDTIASVTFGDSPVPVAKPVMMPPSSDFARDASIVLGSFQSVATSLQGGIDYTEFGREVTELRRMVDKFV